MSVATDLKLAAYVVDAAKAYEFEAQLRQLQEEAAEVIVEVSHYCRGHEGASLKLARELADLEQMIACVKARLDEDHDAAMVRALTRARLKLPA